jgi:hypothetical protein
MGNGIRRPAWLGGFVVVAMLVSSQVTPARAEDGPPMAFRVRSVNTVIADLIQQGIRSSPTFQGLVSAIDASDGLVYVENGRCDHGVRACLWMTVTLSGPHRVLRVFVNEKSNDRELIASIGHELRHAVEVLSHPAVRSDSAMVALYQQEGRVRDLSFETQAAIDAGTAVGDEVRHRRR